MCRMIYMSKTQWKDEARRRWIRKMAAGLLGLACLIGLWTGAGHAETPAAGLPNGTASAPADAALEKLLGKLGGTPADDWTAFALARGGQRLPQAYLSRFERNLDADNLRRATDYARAALVANAAGLDARKAGLRQIDLPAALAKNASLAEEGVHAAAFALMAMDATGYNAAAGDVWTRSALIKLLLDRRAPAGGWAHAPGGSDAEVTGIVLTALAPYYEERNDIRAAVDGALAWLSSVQTAGGGFGQPETSEAAAQVLIALTSLGIDPDGDPRFVKNGKSLLARLLEFQLPDGTFMHRQGGRSDSLATAHALLALTAWDRYRDGLTGLYRGTGSGEPAPVKVVFHSPGGVLAQGYGYGRTALEAVVQVLKAGRVPYQVERDPAQGAVLASAGTYGSRTDSAGSRWKFAIMKERQREWDVTGLSGLDLKDIREIVAYYGTPPAVVSSVKLSPETPREGLPVTVAVETETYHPAAGRASVAPASGVTVTIGGARAVTDARGIAVLDGLKAGRTTLRVDGGTTAIADFEQTLNVDIYMKKVFVRVEGDQGLIAQGEATGGTALEAMEHFLKSRNISFELKDGVEGQEITAIRGMEAGRYGDGDKWRLAVFRQGSPPEQAADLKGYLLEDGMELVLYYGTAETRIPASVTISPARPKAGESVTVVVTHQEWDEETGGYGPARALAGVRVSAAGRTAVTGPTGRAVLEGLPEGVHEIMVSGYAPGQAPAVLRTVRQVAVAGVYPDEETIASWAKDWVHDARAYGVLLGEGGSAGGAFRPKDAVTRAEFVTSLVRGLGIRPASGPVPFADVPPDAWYAGEITAAAEAGLVAGTAPGQFSPEDAITREQAAVLLVRALKLRLSPGEQPADGNEVAEYARQAVQTVMASGWMTAQADGRFHPKQLVTKEQAAVIAVRVVTREGIGRERVEILHP